VKMEPFFQKDDDYAVWALAVDRVREELDGLPAAVCCQVGEIAEQICLTKERIHAFAESAGAREICRLCGGQCCARGKYHFTVPDLLVYFYQRETLFTPYFNRRDACPYLGSCGCFMPPRFRPLNCVIFNCDRIEELIDSVDRVEFYRLEQELRELYGRLESLFNNRFQSGLLITYERDVVAGDGRILRYSSEK
jgi:hypothetical protein